MIKIFSLALMNILIFTTANAASLGKNECMQNTEVAHCSYTDFDTRPITFNMGKYVRISKPKSHLSMVLCLTQDVGNTLLNDQIEEGIQSGAWSIGDDNLFQYEQCANSSCSKTIGGVQKDRFTITKISENQYITEPKLFVIKLYANEGLNCA